jgi:hypothetical protein
VDAGQTDAANGAFDPDGDPRSADGNCDGAALTDIGADELTAVCPGPDPDPDPDPGVLPGLDVAPPETAITAGPRSKTKKRRATFEFTSTEAGSVFECRLDDAQFQACSSPLTVKVGKGTHSFQVRARDAAGNLDPAPAGRTWKVKKRRKRK